MPTSLVTGGAGFIGSHLVEALLAAGQRVLVLDDLSTGQLDNLQAVKDHAGLTIVEGDVADRGRLAELVARADDVYHLAAVVGVRLVVDEPVRAALTNTGPTDELLRLLTGTNKRLFLASTSEVYGKNAKVPLAEDDDLVLGPTTKLRWVYACGKALDEFLALGYHARAGLRVVIGRYFNVVGPRQTGRYGMVVPAFVERALAGAPLQVHGDGLQSRCFAHVADAVRATLALMACPAAEGQVVNIGNDQPITIRGLAELVAKAVNPDVALEQIPYEQVFDATFEDIRQRQPDLARIGKLIGYCPEFGMNEIIRDVVAWYQR